MSAGARDLLTGVILAGGRGTRMGGCDKGLVEIGGHPMAWHVAERLRPQVTALLASANRNHTRYRELLACEVVDDAIEGYAGPLAGMASAMRCCTTRYLLTAPCDSPLLAVDLGARLHRAMIDEDAEICVAHDGERMQPVFALIDCALLESCVAYLAGGDRKIDRWYGGHRLAQADLSDRRECFLNVNRPEDRAAVEALLAR